MSQYDVVIKCSDCGKEVDGVRGSGFTGGFYDVAKGYWKAFSRPGEKRLCDSCMHSRPEYQLVFGVAPGCTDARNTPRGRLAAARMQAAQQVIPNDIAHIFGPTVNTPVKRGGKREQE